MVLAVEVGFFCGPCSAVANVLHSEFPLDALVFSEILSEELESCISRHCYAVAARWHLYRALCRPAAFAPFPAFLFKISQTMY